MDLLFIYAVIIVALTLFFDYTNGFHDAANQVATVIASNTLRPFIALSIAAICNFVGAYFLGTEVAQTIGKGIVDPRLMSKENAHIILTSAISGAITWNLITWYFGIPTSSSHALIGGLLGAFIVGFGAQNVNWNGVIKIFIVMFASPVVGFITAYILTQIIIFITKNMDPSINKFFSIGQIITLITQALSHGTNDGQKSMGVITFAVVILGFYKPPEGPHLPIPHWVILSCSIAIGLGTLSGGWKIIRTLGRGLYKIKKLHSFASQAISTTIIYLTSVFGFPISTTQVITSSIMGTGAAFRFKMVKWQVAIDMLFAWILTIPLSALVSIFIHYILGGIL